MVEIDRSKVILMTSTAIVGRVSRRCEQPIEAMAFKYIAVENYGEGIYIVTLKKPPENRLNVESCQELIRAYHGIVCHSTSKS